ncbi:Smg-4/UPF3 family-domain-containing protein [Fimicolochytrium jonesii]|uniref:Smg-4/UPF3 family-domain-containing protein n=1 Tax=Fimicolochytrium jonesii TaxID=1396493 RepID=UPI0022FEBE13|nr:Smg-4/UPF3 family-domain-containing protein [Fimicolochytrium jonesii]KAI8822573.1 Smg-4/UPF3 family-domain-containing protein [Fimicolochytrium jonesii]
MVAATPSQPEERTNEPTNEEAKSASSRRARQQRGGQRSKGPVPRTKIVVRRLPPNLPENIFETSAEVWLQQTDWWRYVPGKLAKSQAKVSVFSRAYLNFQEPEVMLEFCNKYNGHQFLDGRGNEYRAVVEFAPFQRIPKKRSKPDPRLNTIEQDADYQKFLGSLEEDLESTTVNGTSGLTGETQLEKLEKSLLADQQASSKITIVTSSVSNLPRGLAPAEKQSTPLLDALRAKKAKVKALQDANKAATAAAKQAQIDAKATETAKMEKAKAATKAKPTAGVKPSKTVVGPPSIVKRPDSRSKDKAGPAVAKEPETAQTSPKKQPADNPTERKQRMAPSGSLFNKSLGAVLGTGTVAKRREGARKKLANDLASQVAPDTGAPKDFMGGEKAEIEQPLVKKEKEGGRGYRSKRQAFANPAPEDANGERSEGQPFGTANDGKQKGASQDSVEPEASSTPKSRRKKDRGTGDKSKETSSSSLTTDSPERKPAQKPRKERPTATKEKEDAGDGSPKKGPNVTIMKRDGTSTQFNTRESGAS